MGKKSTTTNSASSTVYGNTTTSNPYAIANTSNNGTVTRFMDGTALDTVYNFVNKNIGTLLNDYLTPNINSATNQAKLNAYTNAMNTETTKNLENNIINPLSNRNMIRSSQATDLYKNLSDANTNALSSYINELISSSQDNSASIINNLLKSYLYGYDVVSDMQNQSLSASKGNAANYNTTTSSIQNDWAEIAGKALQAIAKMYSGGSL